MNDIAPAGAIAPVGGWQPAFAAWVAPGVPGLRVSGDADLTFGAEPADVEHGLIGGLIGAAAGLVVCTAIATAIDDAAVARIATCTASGYALFGGIGFGAGFLIGSAVD